jgi:hypothetical protein
VVNDEDVVEPLQHLFGIATPYGRCYSHKFVPETMRDPRHPRAHSGFQTIAVGKPLRWHLFSLYRSLTSK